MEIDLKINVVNDWLFIIRYYILGMQNTDVFCISNPATNLQSGWKIYYTLFVQSTQSNFLKFVKATCSTEDIISYRISYVDLTYYFYVIILPI